MIEFLCIPDVVSRHSRNMHCLPWGSGIYQNKYMFFDRDNFLGSPDE
jgi:hypothetical protein